MTKSQLRKLMRERRREFVAARGSNVFFLEPVLDLISTILKIDDFLVATYCASTSECSLSFSSPPPFLLALPTVNSKEEPVIFRRWVPGNPLETSPLGFKQPLPSAEPVAPDIILAPLLAFDIALNRLGQGAGHYDRAFAAFPDAKRVGIAWSCQKIDAISCDPWDIPLHAVITETETIFAPPKTGTSQDA